MEGKVVNVSDQTGNSYELWEVNGFFFPRYFTDDPVKLLNNVQNLKGRDDDVIVIAFSKAGTHWVWEITNMLLRGSAKYHSFVKEAQMLELAGTKGTEELTSPRVFNTHLLFKHLPSDMIKRRCKMIYVERNPKDMAVSRYAHNLKGALQYKGTFSDYLPLYMEGKISFGSWFDYTRDWEQMMAAHPDYPVHRLCYEKLKQDPVNEVKNLARFLQTKDDENFIKDVCDSCSFTNLKSSYEQQKTGVGGKVNPVNFAFRKGTVGDWKHWFTVAESEAFDAAIEAKLNGLNKQYIYE